MLIARVGARIQRTPNSERAWLAHEKLRAFVEAAERALAKPNETIDLADLKPEKRAEMVKRKAVELLGKLGNEIEPLVVNAERDKNGATNEWAATRQKVDATFTALELTRAQRLADKIEAGGVDERKAFREAVASGNRDACCAALLTTSFDAGMSNLRDVAERHFVDHLAPKPTAAGPSWMEGLNTPSVKPLSRTRDEMTCAANLVRQQLTAVIGDLTKVAQSGEMPKLDAHALFQLANDKRANDDFNTAMELGIVAKPAELNGRAPTPPPASAGDEMDPSALFARANAAAASKAVAP